MGSTLEVVLTANNKSKPHSYTHTQAKHSKNYKKDAECRYCGKTGHYERVPNKREGQKSGKLKKNFQKQHTNMVEKKDPNQRDESTFIVVLFVTTSDK